ncbi:uncharacterized protein CANTADRAFT_51527 [Suhomyces tanzawaensis NRRL Y-17324]|uniref:BTB domain-containing protein n=1 Tax=Suhomyces tanzawaensis NRRL Y-17324 TaxID=984487 RepID=A0A1E4SIQ7_9ASCO|nr:uncharacterized protein CANTADRAFT_51527 [Suhomyces tanzawaensis NRRL Y-17324]ODV79384.1 hypothetical protein CANTADRAFT_51527 [Suhomyces tanzawaensis NRRL Y-17324]
MTTLIPTASACYTVLLPPTEKDDRLNLNVRTGSASTLYNSFVFTFGGLTIGLELHECTIEEVYNTFHLKILHSNSKFKLLSKYLSGEMFYLSLIDRYWCRVQLKPELPRPKPRLFHEICAVNNCVYLFGGLVIPDQPPADGPTSYLRAFLQPANDLWEFNLETASWTLLHDGRGYHSDPSIPVPRFAHKITIINRLTCVNKKDHFGIFIAGGKDLESRPIRDNVIFDLVDKKYVGVAPVELQMSSKVGGDVLAVDYTNSIVVSFPEEVDHHHHHHHYDPNEDRKKHDYSHTTEQEESLIVYTPTPTNNPDEFTDNPLKSFKIGKSIKSGKPLRIRKKKILKHESTEAGDATKKVVERKTVKQTIPYNLRFPTGGLFGQNVVITGFLPNDYDISIFIYNKPTGKWSRLNIFCNHDYGSHRFWGGYAWQSHHKVVLLGNFITSRTTSSIRYFNLIVTVSLPITNILASSELAGGHHHTADGRKVYHQSEKSNLEKRSDESVTDDSTCSNDEEIDPLKKITSRKLSTVSNSSDKTSPTTISFSEYVHYAAPKTNFTKIRSVFPPAAITLGRNAFDRYGDLISDFEMISSSGERIPVSLTVLLQRWGRYFIKLLAKGYVQAVDRFDHEQASGTNSTHTQKLRTSKIVDEKQANDQSMSEIPSVDSVEKPDELQLGRKDSMSSFSSGTSLLTSHLQDIPPQLPLPAELIPAVPATPTSFRQSSRKNSGDYGSPRASLINTLTQLRNIPTTRSPRDSPFASPRASLSNQGGAGPNSGGADLFGTNVPNLRPNQAVSIKLSPGKRLEDSSYTLVDSVDSYDLRKLSDKKPCSTGKLPSFTTSEPDTDKFASLSSTPSNNSKESQEEFDEDQNEEDDEHLTTSRGLFDNALLNFENIENGKFRMEPSLIPRKLYMPCSTTTIKAFCEYLYTGQVGNKWLLFPTTLDTLAISKFFKVPLLYDLISEVLFGIIGRKEAFIIKEGNKLKKRYFKILETTGTQIDPNFNFPLDEYEGFMDTVDDGYLDIALLKKSSNLHKMSVTSNMSVRRDKVRKYSTSRRASLNDTEITENEERSDHTPGIEAELSWNQGVAGARSDEITYKANADVAPKDGSRIEDSTDDSDKKTTSEEDPEFELKYLDTYDTPLPEPKASQEEEDVNTQDAEEKEQKRTLLTLTLEHLVSPDSPVPPDCVIDYVYESAALVVDMKLILRAANVREMSRILTQSRLSINNEIEKLSKKLRKVTPESIPEEAPPKRPLLKHLQSEGSIISDKTTISRPEENALKGSISLASSFHRPSSASLLKPSVSSSSLSNFANNGGSKSFRGITGFTPFKQSKTDPRMGNKELDKRITKLIKKDEKQKLKNEKDPKPKKSSMHGLLHRNSSKVNLPTSATSSISSVATPSSSKKHHHGFFHLGRKHDTPEDSSLDDNQMRRTESYSASINLEGSSRKTKKFFGLRK